jgi:hypothetical protein
MILALDQELTFLSLVLKYKKCLELAYESPIVGALTEANFLSNPTRSILDSLEYTSPCLVS